MDTELLATAGLDLVQPFATARLAAEPGLAALADPARPRGYLIANTRALWPAFLAARAADPALHAAADPIDRYVEQTVAAAAGPDARIFFAHARYAGGAYLPFQRAAAAAGLGVLTPAHVLVHPIHGPWLGLRAIVLVAGAPPAPLPPLDLPDAHDVATAAAFAHALTAGSWRAWLAVRDACPIGRASRYSDAQIRYHYTKDRAAFDGEISPGDADRPLC